MQRQSRQSRFSSFARLVILVVGTLAVWSIPGAAVAQSEGSALIAPSAGPEAPPPAPATAPLTNHACPTLPTPAPAAALDAAPTLDANRHSENGMQPDLRGWLGPYTQPRLFVTA